MDPQKKLPPALTETLFDARIDNSVREENAEIVGKLREKAVVGRLMEDLSDANEIHYPIRGAISWALEELEQSR